ncbi:hypothetical protein BC939DRAFT_492669 [Gamsiella multidivaricata]|uniref:uncharacterized protein n=1 Tax=Gamsiella multidivaricata TaxID=101098 RepID=UPI00221ED4C6|nr:uncharacterized protein BC939DRAFT_492669 [Gamsiella multidivaricata]KAI7824371.1 hypothetical protein BC939DRAFT_492669 [Gamsiella multidivaricata]
MTGVSDSEGPTMDPILCGSMAPSGNTLAETSSASPSQSPLPGRNESEGPGSRTWTTSAVIKLSGALRNIGSTCYLNSAVQVLRYCNGFTMLLDDICSRLPSQLPTLQELRRVIHRLAASEERDPRPGYILSPINPTKLVAEMRKYHRGSYTSQMSWDTSEPIMHFVEALMAGASEVSHRVVDAIHDLLCMQIQVTRTCSDCTFKQVNTEVDSLTSYFVLPVGYTIDLSSPHGITHSLKARVEYYMERKETEVCRMCRKESCSVARKIVHCPQVLIVHLNKLPTPTDSPLGSVPSSPILVDESLCLEKYKIQDGSFRGQPTTYGKAREHFF